MKPLTQLSFSFDLITVEITQIPQVIDQQHSTQFSPPETHNPQIIENEPSELTQLINQGLDSWLNEARTARINKIALSINHLEPDETAQIILLELHALSSGAKGVSNLWSYLYKVASCKVIDLIDQARRQARRGAVMVPTAPEDLGGVAEVGQAEADAEGVRWEVAEEAIRGGLTSRQNAVLDWMVNGGGREKAKVLGIGGGDVELVRLKVGRILEEMGMVKNVR